jgi:hypothetical protein
MLIDERKKKKNQVARESKIKKAEKGNKVFDRLYNESKNQKNKLDIIRKLRNQKNEEEIIKTRLERKKFLQKTNENLKSNNSVKKDGDAFYRDQMRKKEKRDDNLQVLLLYLLLLLLLFINYFFRIYVILFQNKLSLQLLILFLRNLQKIEIPFPYYYKSLYTYFFFILFIFIQESCPH